MRVDTISFGLQSTLECENVGSGTAPTFDTTNKILNQPSLKYANPINSVLASTVGKAINTSAQSFVTLRLYFYYHGSVASKVTIATLGNTAVPLVSTVPVASIVLTTAAKLELYDGSTQVGSDSAALSADTVYRIDLKIDSRGSSGARIIEARLAGTVFASNTTSATAYTAQYWNVGLNGGNSFTTSVGSGNEYHFGGIAIVDAASGEGEVAAYAADATKIAYLWLAANGDTTNLGLDWSGQSGGTNFTSTGSSPSIDLNGAGSGLFSAVDEHTPDDLTSYVKRNTGGGVHIYGYYGTVDDPVSVGGLGSSDTVNVLHVNMRVGADAQTDSTARRLVAAVKSKSGGTVGEGATGGMVTQSGSSPLQKIDGTVAALGAFCNPSGAGGFNNNGGNGTGGGQGTATNGAPTSAAGSVHTPLLTSSHSPHSGTAWTITGTEDSITNIQVGWRGASTAGSTTTGWRVTTVWVVVEVAPGNQIQSLTGIASTVGVGTPTLNQTIDTGSGLVGIAPTSAMGNPPVNYAFVAGIAPTSTVGNAPTMNLRIDTGSGLFGIAPTSAIGGTPFVAFPIFPTGIAPTSAVGTGLVFYQYDSDEYILDPFPTSAFAVDVVVVAKKAYTTDAGDIQIAVKDGPTTFLGVSGWFALTDTATTYTFTLPSPAQITNLSDVRVWWQTRRLSTDSLLAQVTDAQVDYELIQVVSMTGIGPTSAVGTPALIPLATPAGIAPTSAVGTPFLIPSIPLVGIGSTSAVGIVRMQSTAVINGNVQGQDETVAAGATTFDVQGQPATVGAVANRTAICSEVHGHTATVTAVVTGVGVLPLNGVIVSPFSTLIELSRSGMTVVGGPGPGVG